MYIQEVYTMIKEAIQKIVRKGDLSYKEAYDVMNEIMNGETTPTQNAAFLAALSTKSTWAETIDEISGCAVAMREHATPVPHPGMKVLEIVGTGGDRSNSFNISTTAAFVVAAAGVKVAKHGNRAASSKCGTADVQEALGANINQDPQKALEMLEKVGMCFLFAQKYHAAMKYVGPIRKELGFRTVFNILGPSQTPQTPITSSWASTMDTWWNRWPRCSINWASKMRWLSTGRIASMKFLPALPPWSAS